MITKEIAGQIWNCYHEIEKAEKLLNDMNESLKGHNDRNLIDAFGRRKGLQLGVPLGSDSHRLYDVRPELGVKIVEAHIAYKKAELVELQKIAEIGVETPSTFE